MMKHAFARVVLLALVSAPAFGQPATPALAFVAADVHVSPYRRTPELRATLAGQQYILRDATMLNLVTLAYGMDQKYVVGGPNWLEWDRFDIFAKTPPGTTGGPPMREMMRTLLADRFKLVTHTETRPLPAFVLTVGKGGKPKLKKGSGETGCEGKPQSAATDAVPFVELSCHNMSMEAFARMLRGMRQAHLTDAVVDSTGLKGEWDFDLRFTEKNKLAQAGADGISLFDAIDKQLGLQLAAGTSPISVLVIDSVNEKPTANLPDLAKIMPPPPPAEFDVAVIKPSKAGAQMDGDISGGQVSLQGATLKFLITFAWDLPKNGPMLAGAPKWLDEDKFDITAKAVREANAPEMDEDDLRPMVQKLLAERFKLVTHMEDQPLDAYNLVAVNPKMEKADPTTRARCGQGVGKDGKDPRVTNPILNRLLTCQGITMAMFAGQIQTLASGYIKTPVVDATGLDGAYDFTLSYSGSGKLIAGGDGPEGASSGGASDPSGGISFFDALNKQLGLKLEKVKRPVPVLVIDHVDEKPTEN